MISLSEIGGLYKSMPANLKSARTKAFADACDKQIKKLMDHAEKVKIWCAIQEVEEKYLDVLAADCRVLFYHSGLEASVKRNLVQNSIYWYMCLGTTKAVKEVLTTIYGHGEVQEWFEYGGEPYHFRVNLRNAEVCHGQNEEFLQMLNEVKRLSALLDAVHYIFNYTVEQQVRYGTKLRMEGVFYPRRNTPSFFWDGTVRLDGTYTLSGYLSGHSEDFYPVLLSVWSGADWRTGSAGTAQGQPTFRPWVRLDMQAAFAQGIWGVVRAKVQPVSRLFLQGGISGDVQVSNQMIVQGAAKEHGHMGSGATPQIIGDTEVEIVQEGALQMQTSIGEICGVETDGTLIVEKDLWLLDGSVMLDGSRLLDAEIYKEEI